MKVKFWLFDGWTRFEAVPPPTDMSARSECGRVDRLAEVDGGGDGGGVGRGCPRQSTGGGHGAILVEGHATGSLEAVLSLPAGSMMLSTGMEAVTSPSADGVRVKVKIRLPDGWARTVAFPPATDMSSWMNVAGSIVSPDVDYHGDGGVVSQGGLVSRQGGDWCDTVKGDREDVGSCIGRCDMGGPPGRSGMDAVTSPSATRRPRPGEVLVAGLGGLGRGGTASDGYAVHRKRVRVDGLAKVDGHDDGGVGRRRDYGAQDGWLLPHVHVYIEDAPVAVDGKPNAGVGDVDRMADVADRRRSC